MHNIYFCFIDYAKAFDCVDHKKLWKILVFLCDCILKSQCVKTLILVEWQKISSMAFPWTFLEMQNACFRLSGLEFIKEEFLGDSYAN